MSAFATPTDLGIPAGGWHGTYGKRRLGAGDENTGSDLASDGQADHLVAGRGDHRHQRAADAALAPPLDRKSTRLNSSHGYISYAVFCLKKKKTARPTLSVVKIIDWSFS